MTTRLLVPPLDAEPWPTLGPEVCDFIEDHLVRGPGDVLGDPIELTDEIRLFIYRCYEVYPRGHPLAGRRRFKTEVLSRRKGVGKTEDAAFITIAESHPQGPVRCDGWRKHQGTWVPVGRPVRDPYIPMVAVTEEQVDDLAYGAVYAILTQDSCALVDDYDVGLDRIIHKTAGGKIQPLASAPDARDGARTTFQHYDEPHLFTSPRLRKSFETMQGNLPKRRAADAHSLLTSTMYGPGEGSVLEDVHLLAQAVARGDVDDGTLLFDHRQASDEHDISTDAGIRAFIREASGPDALAYTDEEGIVALGRGWIRKGKEQRFRRYWGNQPRRSAERWLPVVTHWEDRKDLDRVGWPEDGAEVVLCLDGSYSRDSTALVGATVEACPYVFEVRTWERPLTDPHWRTPRNEVIDEIRAAMARWTVTELAPDPPGWHREVEDLEAEFAETVVRFETWQPSRMGPACDDFAQAVPDGELTHDGSEVVARHLGNAVPVQRRGYTVIVKESTDSPDKIDAGVGAVVAHHRARWHFAHRKTKTPSAPLDPSAHRKQTPVGVASSRW